MNPLILSFKEIVDALKEILAKETSLAKSRNMEALYELFPSKSALYSKLEGISQTIKSCVSTLTQEEKEFIAKESQDLDELTQDNALLLKGLMVASQKMIDILIYASQVSQDSLKVYDRHAQVKNNTPFTYGRKGI